MKFFGRPEYCEYIRLLVRLHDLIADGTDELPDGERLRDGMDECSEDFTDDEVASLNGISADFYSLREKPTKSAVRTGAVDHDLRLAIDKMRDGEYATALELIRKNQSTIDLPDLCYLRGRIFSNAGLDDVAIRFFDRAAELTPENPGFAFIALDSMKRFDIQAARLRAEGILASKEPIPPSLLLKAGEVQFEAAPEIGNGADIKRTLIPVFEKVIVEFETAHGPETATLLPLAYALCGFCFRDVAEFENARRCFDQAIKLAPGDGAIRTSRGMLLYGCDKHQAVTDFMKAIDLETPIVWPYLFLAHHYVVVGRFEASLDMCQKSFRFPASAKARANTYEWLAICEAALGVNPDTVRLHFNKALDLAPANKRIESNRRVFEENIGRKSPRDIAWEQVGDDEIRESALVEHQPVA